MSGAETARRRVVQRRNGGAEMALPPYNLGWQEPNYTSIFVNEYQAFSHQINPNPPTLGKSSAPRMFWNFCKTDCFSSQKFDPTHR